jgi:hypothetical protein
MTNYGLDRRNQEARAGIQSSRKSEMMSNDATMKCGKCGHRTDDHVEGKLGWGCRLCYISEQNDRTRITDNGFFLHAWTEVNQLGNKVL